MHILLVEDNLANRELAKMVLEQENLRVTLSESGMDAVKKLAAGSFDIVLMDIQMPEMDGFTATQIIRACESGEPLAVDINEEVEADLRDRLLGRHQPIVALTAHAMRGDRDRCIAAGMDDYLTKPFIPEQVMAVLRRCTGLPAYSPIPPLKGNSAAAQQRSLRERARANLQAAYKLDAAQITELLTSMTGNIRECMEKLNQAASLQDRELLRQTAHALKGILLNLRLMAEASLAEELENRCAQGPMEEIPPLVASLGRTLREFTAG